MSKVFPLEFYDIVSALHVFLALFECRSEHFRGHNVIIEYLST